MRNLGFAPDERSTANFSLVRCVSAEESKPPTPSHKDLEILSQNKGCFYHALLSLKYCAKHRTWDNRFVAIGACRAVPVASPDSLAPSQEPDRSPKNPGIGYTSRLDSMLISLTHFGLPVSMCFFVLILLAVLTFALPLAKRR